MSEMAELLKEAEKIIFNKHPHKKELYRQFESGELARRMEAIGPKVFDPTGKVRWLYKMREAIGENK